MKPARLLKSGSPARHLILLSCAVAMLLGFAAAPLQGEEFVKECMPDFGQHSTGWCWDAAIANSVWWYSEHGFPGLVPWKNKDGSPKISPESKDPGNSDWYDSNCQGKGYPELLEQIARAHGKKYCQRGWAKEALPQYLRTRGADCVLKVTIYDGSQADLVPSMRAYMDNLRACEDVVVSYHWTDPNDPNNQGDHVVTGVSFVWNEPDKPNSIDFSDPWTRICNNSPSHDPNPYDKASVTTGENDKLKFTYGGLDCEVNYLAVMSPKDRPGWCHTFYTAADPQGRRPLERTGDPNLPWGPWKWLGSRDVDNSEGMTVPVGDLWFAHSNVYIPEYYKIVDFELTYKRNADDKPLSWNPEDPGLYGAGYYDDSTIVPVFDDLSWNIESEVQGEFIVDTIHVHMTIDPQPDWEWIHLLDDPSSGEYEFISVQFRTECVPEPATLSLLALGALALVRRKHATSV